VKRSPLPRRAAPMPRTSMKPQGVSLKAAKPVPVQPQDPSILAPRLATAPKRVAPTRSSQDGALRAVSAYKRAYERQLAKLKPLVYARANDRCEAMLDCCTGWAEGDPHHRKLRSAGGLNDLDCCIAVCSACHREIHHNVGQSYRLGLLVHSWDDPAKVKIRGQEAA
jgi:hypothetical protein